MLPILFLDRDHCSLEEVAETISKKGGNLVNYTAETISKKRRESDKLYRGKQNPSLYNGRICTEPVFLNVYYGAPESIPRNEFRQPM
jgi:hypothetical protein